MKKIITTTLTILCFLFGIFGQNAIEKIDSNIYIRTEKKDILIKPNNEFIFISKSSDSTTKYHGNLLDIQIDSVYLDCYYYEEEILDTNIIVKNITILNNYENLLTLDINDMTGFYYSPRWKVKMNETSKSIFVGSLFIMLVAAPLLSMEYKRIYQPYDGFNRKRYTNIFMFGLSTLSISIPLYYISKPRYFKL